MVRVSVVGVGGRSRVRKNRQTMNQFVQVTMLEVSSSRIVSMKMEFIHANKTDNSCSKFLYRFL